MLSQTDLKETVKRCKKGERQAQNLLYQAFYAWAWKICIRYNDNEEDAKTCLQEGFLKALTKIHQYNDDKSFEAWIKKIFVNVCIDQFRKVKTENTTEELFDSSSSEEVAFALIQADVEHLLNLIQTLPPTEQFIFNMYAIEGYKYDEIAEMLQLHVVTVKVNMNSARTRLKNALAQDKQFSNYGR
jgi:RNA polymerase sigma factor (sigma-70 family)